MEPEEARAEIDAARARARETAPRRESAPDPLALPPLPPNPLESAPPPGLRVGSEIPDEWLYRPGEDLAAWKDIFERDLRFGFRSHRGTLGRLIVWGKRLLARFWRAPLSDDLQRTRIFSIALLTRLERTESEIRRYLRDVRDPYSFLRDRAVPDLVNRGDALFGILDRRLEALEAQVAALAERPAVAPAPAPEGSAAARPRPAASSVMSDAAYFNFEGLHRGTEEEIRSRQQEYVERFAGAPGPVVDLGSGRGEMLALLAEGGIPAYGVDANAAMVESARRRGLDARVEDALAHLAALADGSLGGVFSAQTFEHWEREAIFEGVRLIHRKLAPGGVFLMETQNPRSIVVGASSFWRDPTHIRPIHPEAFEFLVRVLGFQSVELREVAPWPEPYRLRAALVPEGAPEALRLAIEDVNRVLGELDERLYGFRDYAVIARR